MPQYQSDRTKIATCSYCLKRTLLQLRDLPGHHELACASCGAPLHEMKPIKLAAKPRQKEPIDLRPRPVAKAAFRPRKIKKRRRKIDWFDLAEDLIEEVFDLLD